MGHNENWQSKIDRYLRKQLSEEESNAFKKEVMENPELANELKLQEDLIAGIKTSKQRDLKNKLKQIHQETVDPEKPDSRATNGMSKIWWIILGVLLLMVLGMFVVKKMTSQPATPEQLYAQYYAPYEYNIQSRDGQSDASLLEAADQYRTGNYEAALPYLEFALGEDPNNVRLKLAIGTCHLEAGRWFSAQSYFNTALKLNDPLLSDRARWYLALAYLQDNKSALAISTLQVIVSDKNADHYQDALELLSQLEK